MQDEVITSLDQVTPEWLTAVLTNSGALTHGAVAAFEVDTGRGNWSTSASLNVRYVDGSQGALPQRLFLKMVNVELEDESFGPSEVTYYTRDYAGVEEAPLVRCYDAAFSVQCSAARRPNTTCRRPRFGTTKLALIHDLDLNNFAPTVINDSVIGMSEYETYRPYLIVQYTVP